MLKKAIALALLAVPCVAFAAPKVELQACKTMENLSEADVKYVGNGFFIDADGNKVAPCSYQDKVYFPIIGPVENGVAIYNEAKSPVIKQNEEEKPKPKEETRPMEEPRQEAGGYRLSYGNGTYEVEDIEEFRRSARKDALGAAATAKDDGTKIVSRADILKALALPDKPVLSLELQNSIALEKKEKLKEDYKTIMQDIEKAYDSLIQTAVDDLATAYAKNNRTYLSKRNIINQYGTQDNEISGIAFALFQARYSAIDFLKTYTEVVDIIATSGDLDERLGYLEFIKEQDIAVLAGKYAGSKIDAVKTELFTPDTVERKGYEQYLKADSAHKAAFLEAVSKANQTIMDKEYTQYPSEITKKQYKALSDIDRYKYAPIQSGQYVNHDKYQKRPPDKLINVPAKE